MHSLLIVSLSLLSCANSYTILGVFASPSRSHYYVGHALMKGLAEDGHEVTVVSPFSSEKPIENYKEVLLEHSRTEIKEGYDVNFWDFTFAMRGMNGVEQVELALASENFQSLLRSDAQFDVVICEIVFDGAFLGLAHHFNAPIIVISPFGASKWVNDLTATPVFASYVPFTGNGYTDRMNFWQRMYNSLSYWYADIAIPLVSTPIQQNLLEKLFPSAKNMPSVEELKRNVSLVFLNSHVTLGTPAPYAPNMIEVGGIHIQRKIDTPPSHIQKFLDEAKNGAIFCSLDSNLLFSKLTNEKRTAILDSFKEHSGIRIIIKSEENIAISSHDPADVLVEPRFPQESILAHPNVKVFITSGDSLSSMESIYFGKPMIGISFSIDQESNMILAEEKGYGIGIPFNHFTTEKLQSAISKIISESSYTKSARLISDRYHDQLKPPLETAIHWVKNVAKNKGTPHLRMVAVDLPFYSLYNLDVWTFILIALLAIAFLVKRILKFSVAYIGAKMKQKLENFLDGYE